MRKVKVIKGRIFKVYFESLYVRPEAEEACTTSCVVIAFDATEAMEKARAAFPSERVGSIHEDRMGNYGGGHPSAETVVL